MGKTDSNSISRRPATASTLNENQGDMYEYRLIQDGQTVASVTAPTDAQARNEIGHYALVYGQDGPVKIERVKCHERAWRSGIVDADSDGD